MEPIMLVSLCIPGAIAFFLIALIIKERYSFLPKESNPDKQRKVNDNFSKQKEEDNFFKRYQDFSGGMMGI